MSAAGIDWCISSVSFQNKTYPLFHQESTYYIEKIKSKVLAIIIIIIIIIIKTL